MVEWRLSVSKENGGLENEELEQEIGALWSQFESYIEKKPEKILSYTAKMVEFCVERREEIEEIVLSLAVTRLMMLDFGISLAEERSLVLADRVWRRDLVFMRDNGGSMASVVELTDGTLELWVGAEILLDQKDIDMEEFVSWLETSFEEYGHMLYDSIKPEDEKDIDEENRLFVTALTDEMEDEKLSDVLYHTIDSEYRGLIWKSWFMQHYLPALGDVYGELKGLVMRKRKELRSNRTCDRK